MTRSTTPLPELKSFVLPGGTAPRPDFTWRARRAGEPSARRSLAGLEQDVNPLVIVYLNRLSDLLFILARAANALDGGRRAALEAGSDAVTGTVREVFRVALRLGADVVRWAGRSHRLLPGRVRHAPTLDRRRAVRGARGALEPPSGPVLEPGRDRDRHPPRGQARRPRRLARVHAAVGARRSRCSRSGLAEPTSRTRAGCRASSSLPPPSSQLRSSGWDARSPAGRCVSRSRRVPRSSPSSSLAQSARWRRSSSPGRSERSSSGGPLPPCR